LGVKINGGSQNQSCMTKFLNDNNSICTGAVDMHNTSSKSSCWRVFSHGTSYIFFYFE